LNISTELNIEKNNNQQLYQKIKELEKIINIKNEQNLNYNLNINLNKDKINELLEE
jgi:hypothetical protein